MARTETSESLDALRVALLVDSFVQPAWVLRIISDIQSSRIARLALVVVNDSAIARERSLVDGVRRPSRLLYAAYERLDRYWFADDRADPFQPGEIASLVNGVPRVHVTPCETGHGICFPDSAVEQILAHRVDVALRFGFGRLTGRSLTIARCGVWSYHHGDDRAADPPGFWEVMDGRSVTGSILQVETDDPAKPGVIYRSYASTSPISVWKNRREYYWKSAAFVRRKLRHLSESGASALVDPLGGVAPAGEGRPSRDPTNIAIIRSLPKVAGRYLSESLAAKTTFDQWFVAYKFAGQAPEEEGVPDTAVAGFTPLIPPKDRIWADPFPVEHRGRYYVLLEELLVDRGKGHISVMEFDEQGRPSRPEVVLRNENHLSYPFILDWNGEKFMIPESARAGDDPNDVGWSGISVFRARGFPDQWEPETVMLEGLEVFDPTVVEIEGRWWLFGTQAEPGASTWDELHLFHGPTPFGPWRPHRRNPVKSDVRSARPAGRLYESGGYWFRPAQDCSVRYGYGLSINRITRLSTTEYEEVEVSRITPTWAPRLIGTHTLNAAGRLTVMDARLRRPRWSQDAPELPLGAPRRNDGDRAIVHHSSPGTLRTESIAEGRRG